MEEILGISQDFTWERRTAVDMLGEDATEADMQMDADEHNRARERYQRLFWEPVVEGQEPILPKELESHRAEGRKNARAAQGIKAAHASLPPRTHEERVVDVSGRPSVTFVDVGGKFVDVDDSVRRLKEAGRRSKLRMQKRQRKEEASRRARAVN
ncbi:hypothetical protein AcW1_001221 [Taiwanofungus camphoratus]|nr:hypothetical protein AcV5_005133 [Antrodia cinnamomea]KAI0962385.1 hypothetical protein AcV7_001237 [Antrodia cinnamomea]KAI0964391.1 hypothetical protein AcW1_001221 [Antrodia cinnamomea]